MLLKQLSEHFTVCKISDLSAVNWNAQFCFFSRTDEEFSLVCITADTPSETVAREDGWRCFRVQGILDFSLTGILSRISGILAENKIGIFAVSTYNTDYIFVKGTAFEKAMTVLKKAGYPLTD